MSTQKYTYYSGELGIFDLEVDLPQHGTEQVPYMIYIHGGGWQHGDLNVFKNIRFVWRKEVLQVLESLIL